VSAEQARGAVPLHAMILEDNPADVDLMLHELRRSGFDPRHCHVDNERDYRACLAPDLDVILADYRLPQFNALEALRILQDQGLSVPFIVVTGSISEEAAVSCMKSGATDYLLKDRLARLGPAIRQALESRRIRDAKLKAEKQIIQRNQELSLLNRIIAASAKAGDEWSFFQVVCQETSRAMGAFLTAAFTLDGEGGEPEIVAEHSEVPGLSLRSMALPPRWGAMTDMLVSLREPAVINNLRETDPLSVPHAEFIERQIASMAIVPLVVDGVTVGGLGLFADAPGHFSGERDALLRSVADELSGALARARLKRDRLLLGAAVEQTTDGVMILSPEGVIRSLNTGFERLTGRARAELVGKPASALMDEKPEPAATREILQFIRERREWRGRMTATRQDGSAYTADVTFSPVREGTGEISSYLVMARDVTQALELESRYLQAQKLEAVGRLAGGVSHDFNNLLTSIMGFAEILADRLAPDSPGGNEIRQIQTAAERASALTRQLLAFGRRQVLAPRLVSLNEVVSETETLLRPLLGKSIELATRLEPGLRTVMPDPGQIGQVIMNLAINARDAMPDGGRILVTTENLALDEAHARQIPDCRPGTYVALRIADTGSGIGPEILPHIFEPFYTTKGAGKGTGLGLAIVFGIVKQSGGNIRVTSEVGRGTTFEVLLPAGADREAYVHG